MHGFKRYLVLSKPGTGEHMTSPKALSGNLVLMDGFHKWYNSLRIISQIHLFVCPCWVQGTCRHVLWIDRIPISWVTLSNFANQKLAQAPSVRGLGDHTMPPCLQIHPDPPVTPGLNVVEPCWTKRYAKAQRVRWRLVIQWWTLRHRCLCHQLKWRMAGWWAKVGGPVRWGIRLS